MGEERESIICVMRRNHTLWGGFTKLSLMPHVVVHPTRRKKVFLFLSVGQADRQANLPYAKRKGNSIARPVDAQRIDLRTDDMVGSSSSFHPECVGASAQRTKGEMTLPGSFDALRTKGKLE